MRLYTSLSPSGFPQAHTCFFQLDLPNYSTDEAMRSKLSAAAQLCGEIDTDGGPTEDLD